MKLQKTRPGVVLVTALAALAAACAAKHATTSVERGQSLVALLPDPETEKTGRATVWNKTGSADLDSERKAVLTSEKHMGRVAKLSHDDVERLFGAALGGAAARAAQLHALLQIRI